MPFIDKKTPLKPTCEAKYKLHVGPNNEYMMNEEQEKAFIRLFPVTYNERMMELFGISFSTLHKFKRKFGLKKNMKVIYRKQASDTKKKLTENGYYASIKGKRPSEQCQAAYKAKVATGWNPLKSLKENNPRKFRSLVKKKMAAMAKQREEERALILEGKAQKTRFNIVLNKMTSSQSSRRHNALKRGYIVGDYRVRYGERFTLFYDKDTDRSEQFEQNCIADGFEIKRLIE